jgi:phytoene/squalene synthetase
VKNLYDEYSFLASKEVTRKYSTSFYAGVNRLDKRIRADIHSIYGFVRVADEIVDSFHDFDKAGLLKEFSDETFLAIERGISVNPILNAFQLTVNKYNIDHALIIQFLKSMEMDLNPVDYTQESYEEYILGSAEVVGLMCLKVFVYGDEDEYAKLKPYAIKLGSAFQKINFLRDLNDDVNELGRIYFPDLDVNNITKETKIDIENEIQKEFDEALIGIKMLPKSARLGVYISYRYYVKLLNEIKQKQPQDLLSARVRVPDSIKVVIFCKCLVRNSMNLL